MESSHSMERYVERIFPDGLSITDFHSYVHSIEHLDLLAHAHFPSGIHFYTYITFLLFVKLISRSRSSFSNYMFSDLDHSLLLYCVSDYLYHRSYCYYHKKQAHSQCLLLDQRTSFSHCYLLITAIQTVLFALFSLWCIFAIPFYLFDHNSLAYLIENWGFAEKDGKMNFSVGTFFSRILI